MKTWTQRNAQLPTLLCARSPDNDYKGPLSRKSQMLATAEPNFLVRCAASCLSRRRHCAGSTKQSKIKFKQSQDNLRRLCKELLTDMSINVTYYHVKGHMDGLLRKGQLSLEETLNVEADELADEVLKKAVRENTKMIPAFHMNRLN